MLAPTGTVTLVFTVLRAAERLWSESTDTMRVALNLHDKIVRESLRRHKGYEVKSENGSFMLAFSDAVGALQFASDIQMRLLCADWPDELLNDRSASPVRSEQGRLIFAGLRVSVGIHRGEAECRIDPTTGRMDYFGPTANRAARIAAAAHEGQILLSRSLDSHITTHDQWQLTDLGTHQLRGLEGAIALCELKPKSLKERRFPPPLTLDAIRTNLQSRKDRFIGRSEQLEAIARSFEQGHRLITLMGTSGLGKTRLAQRFGGLHLGAFTGGVWFCDLSEAETLSDIITCVGHALAIPLTSGRSDADLLNQIGAQLAEKGRALLILDNLEQVIEPSAHAIEQWLATAESICVLATSQERLRLSTETTHPVRPLTTSESAALFTVRAKETRADFNPSNQERTMLGQIVTTLDCMPLAIELAAAQIRHMSLITLNKEIQNRLDILSDEHRNLPKRHQTLRAAIDWSWDRLTEHEQDVLRQASVFRGGFCLEAAEKVIEPSDPASPWVMDVLESLNDKSLLLIDDQSGANLRFSMYESIRIYAEEALNLADPNHLCRIRHATYFTQESLRYSSQLYGPSGTKIRLELTDNLKNLQAVHQWSKSSPAQRAEVTFAQLMLRKLTGPLRTRGSLLESIAQDLHHLEPELQGKLLRARAEYEADSGESLAAKETLHLAFKYAQEAADEQLQGQILGSLGLLHRQSAEITQARVAFTRALEHARSSGDDRTRSSMLNNLAALEHDQARFADAEELFIEALDLCLAREHALGAATAQLNLGTINLERGDLNRSRHFYQQALDTFKRNDDQNYESMVITLLGLVDLDEGQFTSAKKRFDRALQNAADSGDSMIQIMSECWHGVAHWLGGEDEAAFLRLRAAVGIMRNHSNPKILAFVHGYYGAILAQRGRVPEAREKFRLARYLMRQTNNRNHLDSLRIMVGIASAALAQAAYDADDHEAYERHLAMALQRRQFANRSTEPNEAFPNGLPKPIARSTDARMCLLLLNQALSKLPVLPEQLKSEVEKTKTPRDTLPPLESPQTN